MSYFRSEAVGRPGGTVSASSDVGLTIRCSFSTLPFIRVARPRILDASTFSETDMPWRPRQSFARLCVDVWVTDNSSTKRCGQYNAYAVTRAADGPDGMEARGRPFSVGGKGLTAVRSAVRGNYKFWFLRSNFQAQTADFPWKLRTDR